MAKVNNKSAVSLPAQIKQDIKQKIFSGRLKPEEKLHAEGELAKEYGVSRMTMRQALFELATEGILYRVPGRGTFIAGSSTDKKNLTGLINNFIMLIVPNLRHSFFYQIIHGVEKNITGNGDEVLLRSTDEDSLKEQHCLQKLLKGEIKGLILVSGNYSHTNITLLQKIKQRIPIIIVDVAIPGLETDLVVSDDRHGGFLITRHLIELGHKRILHLAGPEDDSSAKERLIGYHEALKKYQIEFQPELIRYTDWYSEEGYYETKKFFLNGTNKEKASAIFACNDEVATGAFKVLTELNLKVPEEVALAGYGNLDVGKFLEVPLTTVNQSAGEMGKIASQLLLDKLSGHREFNEQKEIKCLTKLIIRQSCGIRKQHTPNFNIDTEKISR